MTNRVDVRKPDMIDLIKKNMSCEDVLFIRNMVNQGKGCMVVIPGYRLYFSPFSQQNVTATQLTPPFKSRRYIIALSELGPLLAQSTSLLNENLNDEERELPIDFDIVNFMYGPERPPKSNQIASY